MKLALVACVLLVGFSNAELATADETNSTKPNVLFIAVDDLRPELGCYGHDKILTPNIDRLASNSVVFDRAYCQVAVCNPSRVSCLTGLRPDTTQVWDLATRFRHTMPDAITLPQHFKQHGYHAVSFGKIFHNPWPDNDSWSEPHAWPSKSSLWSKNAKQRLTAFKQNMRADGKPQKAIDRMRSLATEVVDVPDRQHIDGAIAQQAIESMRRLSQQDKPFFLATGFIRPHLPFVVPRKYWEMYQADSIPLATNQSTPKDAPAFAMNTMYELRDYMDFHGTPRPNEGSLTEEQQRRLKHGYYASVSFIDAQIGRLLGELETLNLSDNTIVVLWGDHGWKLGEHNSWCKQTNYEIDTRVPLIVRAPQAKANGEKTDALVELIDLYPTLCELAGLTVPSELEGRSMVPLLSNPGQPWKEAAVSQFQRRVGKKRLMGYSMRTDRYRYVEWQDRRTREVIATELYDHTNDSAENRNVAEHPKHESMLNDLSRQMWATLPQPPDYEVSIRQDADKSRPNIVFCMADDWSWPHAGILGDPVVKTPSFDQIAREGVLFENAFVSTPSCTPSRLSILTGQHHWRLREGDSLGGSLRETFDVYTELLQKAGYRIGRFGKGVWPSKHTFRKRDSFGERFRSFDEFLDNRKPGEPFCYWHGGQDPHRPYELGVGIRSGMDPSKIKVPACLPDSDIVRGDVADYLWEVQRFDREVGQIVARLEAMGELDNTIIVVSGDNGMPFPRCKATLYDQGTRVPLAIRWGSTVQGGRQVSDFVSLCDLAPTFLEAAGLNVSSQMTGKSLVPILKSKKSGQIDPNRMFALTGMERHVYLYPSRAIRTKDFLYIRNFGPDKWPTGEIQGHNPRYDFLEQPWPTEKGAFSFNIDPSPSKQFLRLRRDEKDAAPFAKLAFLRHPEDELYDLVEDPHQLNNVAEEAQYADVRRELRQTLLSELVQSHDPRVDAGSPRDAKSREVTPNAP